MKKKIGSQCEFNYVTNSKINMFPLIFLGFLVLMKCTLLYEKKRLNQKLLRKLLQFHLLPLHHRSCLNSIFSFSFLTPSMLSQDALWHQLLSSLSQSTNANNSTLRNFEIKSMRAHKREKL